MTDEHLPLAPFSGLVKERAGRPINRAAASNFCGARKHQEVKLAMAMPKKAVVYHRKPPSKSEKRSTKGSRVGDDLVEAFEEMARHLRGEIELKAHDLPGKS